MRLPELRTTFTAAIAGFALVALSACVPTDNPGPTPVPTSSESSASPTATATPTPEPTVSATPVTMTCDELLSLQAMYDFNPNFGLLGAFTPATGSPAAFIVANKGIACRWQNQSSGELLDIAVAHLTEADLTRLKNDLVVSSNSVPTYGVEGYFQLTDGVGRADAFADPFWIVATSTAFFEPGDAEQIMTEAVSNVG